MTEKSVEIVTGDDGVVVLVRPAFPFEAEGYRIKDGFLVIFGQGRSISFTIPSDIFETVRGAEAISLMEFPVVGERIERELILSRVF